MNHLEEQSVTDRERKSKPRLLRQWQFWLAVAVGFIAVLCSPIWFIIAIEVDKAERAERAARERDWHNTFTFHSEIHRDDGKSQVNWGRSYEYHFVDQVGEEGLKYDFYDCRENKLLLSNVVRWQKVDKQLCLMTKSKELRVLDFESGKMVDYPSSACATNAALELAFDRLQEGFDKHLQVDLDDVKLFASYAELEEWPNLPQIVPRAAKDIMAYCAPVFQGELARARCRLTSDEFQKFAQTRGCKFTDYDLCLSQGRTVHRDDEDPVFAHFPPCWCGEVIGHHADGFSICEAIRPGSSKRANESLVYVYDSKCEMLWIKYSR